ncbi:MAG: hypothetical protein IIW34_00720, partial [Clostridia bacterium]|nr:hypothetical protein [Clostridia bacterium]
PYEEFENAPSAIFRPIYSGMEIGINRLNDAVKSNAEIGNYIVVDIKAAFDSYTGTDDLHNADPSTENMNVDFHPTPAGHRLIADTLLSVLSTITPEDITNIDIIPSDEGLMLQVKACFKNRADKMITGSVWCAVYDNYGRMTGIDTLRINDVAPNTASDMVLTIALADPYDEDVRIGFFLLDSTSFIPLISDRIYN